MSIYCVTYDLKSPGKDYTPVHNYLKKYTHCKKLESFWLIDTNKKASAIRDELEKLVDSNDIIFVAEIKKHWAGLRFDCAAWLKETGRSW